MANKKRKQKQEEPKRQMSKQEKQLFSLEYRAHDSTGNPVDWNLIRSLWST